MMQTMILTLDLGSTSFKAAVFDSGLKKAGEGSAALEYCSGSGGKVEFSADGAEESVRTAVAAAFSDSSASADMIRAVAVTSQAQTFTVLKADGELKIPFVSWLDTRAAKHNRLARDLGHFAEHSSVDECLPILMAAKLAFCNDQPSVLVSGQDLILPLPAFLMFRMCGKACIDPNIAAMSGLYSLKYRDWWDESLDTCRITRGNLPALCPTGKAAAVTNNRACEFGIPAGIPFVPAGNDQTAGAYGAELHAADALLITLGTAQVAYRCTPCLPFPVPGTMRGTYPGGRYYQMAADKYGGCTVNWAKTVLDGCSTDEAFAEAAGSADGSCPPIRFIADGNAGSGRWEGITGDHTASEKARAVLECLTDRMTEMICRMNIDLTDRTVLAAGGGSRCTPWVRMLGAKLGKKLQTTDASPGLGAARMAAENCGT